MLDFIHRLWGTLTAGAKSIFSTSSFIRLLLSGLGVLVIAYLFDFITFPFWPFTTQGKIYVDSPEVYTRERLVNDRYDQDYWLRMRLKELDEPGKLQLMAGESRTFSKVQIGAAPIPRAESGPDVPGEDAVDSEQKEPEGQEVNPPAADQAATSSSEGFRLPFDQEFRVAAGIRDMIRQQVLENMLDDRHDLTGNSVYGLKFDTTVIPGSNTRQRAIVRVSLTVDDLFQKSGTAHLFANSFSHYLQSIEEGNPSRADFDGQEAYYFNWLKDLEKRLNNAEKSVYNSMVRSQYACPTRGQAVEGLQFMHILARNTLNVVLGIPTELFANLNPVKQVALKGNGINPGNPIAFKGDGINPGNPIEMLDKEYLKLPDPWARFFLIERNRFEYLEQSGMESDSCSYRISFAVNELLEPLILIRPGHPVSREIEDRKAHDCDGEDCLIRVGKLVDSDTEIYVRQRDFKRREIVFEDIGHKYPLAAQHFDWLWSAHFPRCDDNSWQEHCSREEWLKVTMPSGLFNFIEKMSARDAYAYAIFPKNDIASLLVAAESQLDSSFLGFAKQLRESITSSLLVGFGEGPEADPRDFPETKRLKIRKDDKPMVFGWVISARGTMQPTQKNQLALVSVPAWANKLNLRIERGWIDRQGRPQFDSPDYDLEILIPPSLEVFDFIFRDDARVTLGPTIRQSEMDRNIYLRAGRGARVLVPGSRLWRSATVTLGAQSADRIRVLPNMEGIIAEFSCLNLPSAAYQATSEGMNDARPGNKETCTLPEFYKGVSKGLFARPVTLRVWTSEGVTKSNPYVCVIFDRRNVAVSGRDYCNSDNRYAH